MNIDFKHLALFMFGLVNSGLCFAGDAYSCPDTVHLASGIVAPEDVPSGYESRVSDSILRLSGNNLYDGPPENGGQLKPTASKGSIAGSKGNVTTWKLTGKYPDGVWISCDYAEGWVKIVARIKDTNTNCVATTKKVPLPRTIETRFFCN